MSVTMRSLARQLPPSVISALKKTPLDGFYHRVIRESLNTVKIDVECGGASQRLQVPEDSIYVRSDNYEPVLVSTLCERLQADSGAVYYDVGSEYGYYLALAQAAGLADANIYGFDMNPYAEHILSQNYRGTDVTLTIGRVGDGTNTDTISLDQIASEHQPPDIAKIDVEGAEALVLRGMRDILESVQPELFLELHPEKLPRVGIPRGSDSEASECRLSASYD